MYANSKLPYAYQEIHPINIRISCHMLSHSKGSNNHMSWYLANARLYDILHGLTIKRKILTAGGVALNEEKWDFGIIRECLENRTMKLSKSRTKIVFKANCSVKMIELYWSFFCLLLFNVSMYNTWVNWRKCKDCKTFTKSGPVKLHMVRW